MASEKGGPVRCVRCHGLTRSAGSTEANAPQPHFRSVEQLADYGLPLDGPGWTSREPRAEPAPDTFSAAPSLRPPPVSESLDDLEDWTLAAELRQIRHRYDAPAPTDTPSGAMPPPHLDRFGLFGTARDPAAWPATRPADSAAKSAAAKSTGVRESAGRKGRRASPLVWTALSLGLMTFVCGGVLLGWSLAASRSDLWNLGLPIMLGGQFGLLLGLLLQLENLWEGNRHTVDKLDEVDDRLDDLKQTAALLTSSHSSPAQAFYVHMAGGASPQLLLADLKGQLDLLATQMAVPRR